MNRQGCVVYIKVNVLGGLDQRFIVFDPTQENSLLDINFGQFRIRGTADAMISSTTMEEMMI